MADEEIITPAEQTAETPAATKTPPAEAPKADDAPKTILSGGDGDDVPAPSPGDTPGESETNWRDGMAGEDEKFRKQLDRFSDTAALGKAYRALQQKMSSGDYTKALADDASDEEKATWRKENKLPENAEGFVDNIALPDGMVLGDVDKPLAANFGKMAMDANLSQEQYNKAVSWHYDQQDAAALEQAENDAANKTTVDDALRAEWGGDYRANINAINNMTNQWPEGLEDSLFLARSPDGNIMGDDPVFVKQMAQMARELNPAATLVPAGTTDTAAGVDERIKEMKGWMGASKDSDNWNKYWKDDKVQAEYAELINAKQKLDSRAA